MIEGPLGKGRIILVLAPGLPWSWGEELIVAARGEALKPGRRLVPGNPSWGTMALAALDASAVALPAWSSAEELAAFIADPAAAKPGSRRRDQQARPNDQRRPGCAAGASARRVEVRHFRDHLAFPQRAAIPTLGQPLQPPLARRRGRRRLSGQEPRRRCGIARGSITTRSTNRTCRKSSWTR